MDSHSKTNKLKYKKQMHKHKKMFHKKLNPHSKPKITNIKKLRENKRENEKHTYTQT